MNNFKEHIVFKIITLLLVVTLFTPLAVKITHTFSHHEHKICSGETSTHIHKVDLDCEFQKFQLNTHFLVSKIYKQYLQKQPNSKVLSLTYKFLNSHQKLSFSLRGPPYFS